MTLFQEMTIPKIAILSDSHCHAPRTWYLFDAEADIKRLGFAPSPGTRRMGNWTGLTF